MIVCKTIEYYVLLSMLAFELEETMGHINTTVILFDESAL